MGWRQGAGERDKGGWRGKQEVGSREAIEEEWRKVDGKVAGRREMKIRREERKRVCKVETGGDNRTG